MSKARKATKKGNSSVTDRETAQEEIRALAYQVFYERGCEHGHDVEHWLEAEQRVLERYRR